MSKNKQHPLHCRDSRESHLKEPLSLLGPSKAIHHERYENNVGPECLQVSWIQPVFHRGHTVVRVLGARVSEIKQHINVKVRSVVEPQSMMGLRVLLDPLCLGWFHSE